MQEYEKLFKLKKVYNHKNIFLCVSPTSQSL